MLKESFVDASTCLAGRKSVALLCARLWTFDEMLECSSLQGEREREKKRMRERRRREKESE